MLNSTFSLIGNQFNLTSSRQARDEITCTHSSGVREQGSLLDVS